jgi:hypothetical protein
MDYAGICIAKGEILDDIVAARSQGDVAEDERTYLSFDREDLVKSEAYWGRIRGFLVIRKVRRRRVRLQ